MRPIATPLPTNQVKTRKQTLRVLVAHNSHKIAGGEQRVFETETALLESGGHHVTRFNVHNDDVDALSGLTLAKKTIWNSDTFRKLVSLIDQERPDIVHVHNIVPLISPAVFKAAKSKGVPTVWTLHNYRLICPGMHLLRDGRPCESCVSKTLAVPGIIHRCYRNSFMATTAVATMQAIHRTLGTWHKHVNCFIAPSEFTRSKLIEGGLPADKLITKGNFVVGQPQVGCGDSGSMLFVGRFSEEKGISVLLDAWMKHHVSIPLKIVGQGPMEDLVRQACEQNPLIQWLGRKTSSEVMELMGQSIATIVPSTCYETFGMVVAESLAVGTPVIASHRGALAELIEPRQNGLLFETGNSQALAESIEQLQGLDQAKLRSAARESYECKHTAKSNLERLESIYTDVIDRFSPEV